MKEVLHNTIAFPKYYESSIQYIASTCVDVSFRLDLDWPRSCNQVVRKTRWVFRRGNLAEKFPAPQTTTNKASTQLTRIYSTTCIFCTPQICRSLCFSNLDWVQYHTRLSLGSGSESVADVVRASQIFGGKGIFKKPLYSLRDSHRQRKPLACASVKKAPRLRRSTGVGIGQRTAMRDEHNNYATAARCHRQESIIPTPNNQRIHISISLFAYLHMYMD